MDKYDVHVTEDQFLIKGLPEDAVKIVSFNEALPGQSHHLWSLTAHRLDLTFAKTCLDLIKNSNADVQTALWRTAIIYYAKCFAQPKEGGRKPLNPRYLPAGLPREIHVFFASLRNKNFIHDENGWLQTWAGAVIAAPGKNYNIEKIICGTTEGETLTPEHYGNMYLLVEHAIAHVNSESDKLCDEITAELEKVPREKLLDQPPITYRAPVAEEVQLRRGQIPPQPQNEVLW
jgi:hypothetical protein